VEQYLEHETRQLTQEVVERKARSKDQTKKRSMTESLNRTSGVQTGGLINRSALIQSENNCREG